MILRARDAIGFVAAFGVFTAVFFLIALKRPWLVEEDGVVESVSAVAFFLAFLGAAFIALRPGRIAERLAAGGLAALCALLGLSEISFGARIFGLEMPAMEGGGEFDGGHDIAIMALRAFQAASDTARLAVVGAISCALAVSGWVAWRQRRILIRLARFVAGDAVLTRLVVALAALAAAVVLDLVPANRAMVLEEVLELMAGLALLAATVAALRRRQGRRSSRLTTRAVPAAIRAVSTGAGSTRP